jgi:hypothetical protein
VGSTSIVIELAHKDVITSKSAVYRCLRRVDLHSSAALPGRGKFGSFRSRASQRNCGHCVAQAGVSDPESSSCC